jgi:hypothetical protein
MYNKRHVKVNIKSCKSILCYVKQCKCKNKYIYMVLQGHVKKINLYDFM